MELLDQGEYLLATLCVDVSDLWMYLVRTSWTSHLLFHMLRASLPGLPMAGFTPSFRFPSWRRFYNQQLLSQIYICGDICQSLKWLY